MQLGLGFVIESFSNRNSKQRKFLSRFNYNLRWKITLPNFLSWKIAGTSDLDQFLYLYITFIHLLMLKKIKINSMDCVCWTEKTSVNFFSLERINIFPSHCVNDNFEHLGFLWGHFPHLQQNPIAKSLFNLTMKFAKFERKYLKLSPKTICLYRKKFVWLFDTFFNFELNGF